MTRRYIAWRLAQVVPTVVGIVIVAFLLIHVAPGDPVLALAGEHGDAAYYAFMRERFGLDRPLMEQLATFVRRALTGDIGMSYVQGRAAMTVVLERIPATLLLMLTAIGVSTIAGLAVGMYSGTRAGRPGDLVVTSLTLLFTAAPAFLVSQVAVLVFAHQLGLFPTGAISTPGTDFTGFARVTDVVRHLALPALVLAATEVAAVARLTRRVLASELETDHVRTARAKGLTPRVVVMRHAMRRVLFPVLTVVGGRIGHVLGGAIVVEFVFSWPGIGRLLVTSMEVRDTPVLLSLFLVIAGTVVLANLVTDLIYTALDPRIRYD